MEELLSGPSHDKYREIARAILAKTGDEALATKAAASLVRPSIQYLQERLRHGYG